MEDSPARNVTESAASDILIHIVGANAFNNELLSSYLQGQIERECFCLNACTLSTICDQFPDKTKLIFYDCSDLSRSSAKVSGLSLNGQARDPHCLLVCFNVDPQLQVEHEALRRGVRGVIYHDQPMDLYPRAAHAVLDGELWYPREVLQAYLFSDVNHVPPNGNGSTLLTRRERTILHMMALGESNKRIAKELCISPHTVKTHAYNLYKKINVSNRYQAAIWWSQQN